MLISFRASCSVKGWVFCVMRQALPVIILISLTFFQREKIAELTAIFGPQHGIYGQTQDNMIEWEGGSHQGSGIPIFSLYGRNRKPTPEMLKEIDVLIIDLQDVGARLYTYVWTVKLCMEACMEAGIPVWILDRPNPIGKVPCDGPVLKEEYFTFVGGASIPLCHRMTMGEMALWIKEKYYGACDLNIVWMEGWRRNSLFSETGLPWVLPSPNMPTLQTAIVYPGTVLFEGSIFPKAGERPYRLSSLELRSSIRRGCWRSLERACQEDADSGNMISFQPSINTWDWSAMEFRSMLPISGNIIRLQRQWRSLMQLLGLLPPDHSSSMHLHMNMKKSLCHLIFFLVIQVCGRDPDEPAGHVRSRGKGGDMRLKNSGRSSAVFLAYPE